MILLPLVKVFASSSSSSSKSSSSSLEKTLFLASLLFIGINATRTWTTTAQRLSDTPSSFSSKSLGEEEGDDDAGRRIPPTTTFHPPSGSYPAPVAVRVTQSEEGGASVASCEKILVTVDGEALDDKVSYANTPVVLDREGVYVVKAVCLTGTVFGKQNRAEYVVLPKNDDDDEGSVYSNTTKDGKRRAGGIFLGIVLIVGMLATLGVCGAAFQSFRGEFHRGAQRFVGPGVGEIRRSRLGSVGSGSAADFVNWFERNRERAVANGSRLLSDLEMSSASDLPRTGSGMNNPVSLSNEGNEFTLDDPDEANKRD